MYKNVLKNKYFDEFISLIIEIMEDTKQLFIDFEKYIERSLDELDALFEKTIKNLFAQGEKGWEDMIWQIKFSIVLFTFICYYRDLDNPLRISTEIFIKYEELKIILPPIVQGPVWNENLGQLFIYETPRFCIDPNLISRLVTELTYPFDFWIGVNWFLC